MNNTLINKIAIKKIATALEELNESSVFTGGSVVSLYIDDPAADDVRPTKDIDIFLEITSQASLENLRQKLVQKGFTQSHEDDVVCRFRYEEITIDVMSTIEVGWAPANTWFAPGFKNVITKEIDSVSIRILSLPFFLASKFNAFQNRGGRDPRASHDFEDIVYILNYTSDFKEQILHSEPIVRQYLKDRFCEILADDTLHEAIIGNLYSEDQMKRYKRIINELKTISRQN